jgi:hypothetical protein
VERRESRDSRSRMKHPPRDQDHKSQGYDAYFQVNEDKSSRRALGGGDYFDQRDLEGNESRLSSTTNVSRYIAYIVNAGISLLELLTITEIFEALEP